MPHIYSIQNRRDLTLYIGQTNNPRVRWNGHKSAARKGSSRPLYKAMREHGFDAFVFQVIEQHDDQKACNEAERFWIEYFKADCHLFGYNLAAGGTTQHCAASRRKMSDKAKVSQRKRFADPSNREKHSIAHMTDATLTTLDANRLLTKTPQSLAKQSRTMTDMWLDPEYRAKVVDAHSGKAQSAETRQKRSQSMTGKRASTEARERMSLAAKQREAVKKSRKDLR